MCTSIRYNESNDMAEKRAKRWKLILTVVTLAALAGLFYFVRHEIAETVSNLGRVNRYALLLILPAQMLGYYSYTKMYQNLFRIFGHHIRFKNMLKTTAELNFVNLVFPSGGVSGFSYFGVRMRSHGVSAGKATLTQLLRFILFFISFQILLSSGLILLSFGGQASGFLLLVASSLATLLFVGTFIGAYIVGSKRRIHNFFTFLT